MADYNQNLECDYEASASSKPINLKLIFTNDVASPVFTQKKITGKEGGTNESIKVILVDATTGQKVTTGPVASAKVKIVLLRGTYDGEFEKNIVVDWGKKKKLLLGNVDIDLEHGSGTVGSIRIKHDRYPIKNVEFRLGAMVVDCLYKVKQAITQSFEVKDRRNEPKSLRSLTLACDVCQLKNIRKRGMIHKRLEASKIYTVKDFLDNYSSNRKQLQEIYGIIGKKWEITINHAKTCITENVGNAPKRVVTMPPFEDGGNIELYNGCYIPQPCENDSYGAKMIVDQDFSIQDFEEGNMISWSLPYQDYGEDGMGRHDREGKSVKAKKRWIKIRTLLFSIASFFVCE